MPNDLPEISLDQLTDELAGAAPPLVAEILGPQHFAIGHVPGALNLPLEGFVESATRLLPDKRATIVVYCASQTCKNSDVAQRTLRGLGYQSVRVFRGGKAAWQDAGRPLATG